MNDKPVREPVTASMRILYISNGSSANGDFPLSGLELRVNYYKRATALKPSPKWCVCSHSYTYLAFHAVIVCILGTEHTVRPHLDY